MGEQVDPTQGLPFENPDDLERAPGTCAADPFRLVAAFPPLSAITDGELFSLILTNNTTGSTHSLHRFPAKFIPQIPAWALKEFGNESSVVLDPFCGSGTTLVEALTFCRRSIGIDSDPLACLIASAKTFDVGSTRMLQLGRQLREAWVGPAGSLEPPIAGVTNFGHWFSERSWADLQSLLASVHHIDCNANERRFLLGIFSSVIRWVSNADDQTQKTYVSGTLSKCPPEVSTTFWRAFDRAIAGLVQMERTRLPGAQATVIHGDATCIDLPKESVDLIVTSPPYLDSVDYMYNFMLEYFWLGPLLGVKDRSTFNRMRREGIGAKNPLLSPPFRFPSCLTDLISDADFPVARLRAAVAYCEGMAAHFKSAWRVLKPGGHYVLVVGNSQTKSGVLPIHDSLIRLAADAGFKMEKAFAYRIRRHYMKFPRKGRGGIITMDWVIVMRKESGPVPYPSRLPLPDFRLRDDEVAS